MFDFEAVAKMAESLTDYARIQQGWIASGYLGDTAWKAEKRMRRAAEAAKALRAFLHSSETGYAELTKVSGPNA